MVWCEVNFDTMDQCFQGKRLLDDDVAIEKLEIPSICLLQDELEGEDYIFRTNVDELNT